jgi:hypothetical protein
MKRYKDVFFCHLAEKLAKYPSRDSALENTECENWGHKFVDGICERCQEEDVAFVEGILSKLQA